MITIVNIDLDLHLRVKIEKDEIYKRILKILEKEFEKETHYNSDISLSIEQLNYVGDEI